MPMLKLESSAAKRLVDLLSTDDAFRHLFVTDTESAILTVGHLPEDRDELTAFVKQCCANVVLAEKQDIAKARTEIFSMLTSGTAYTVPMLEYGRIRHAEGAEAIGIKAA